MADEKTVSQKEIDAVEAEVNKKQAEEMKKVSEDKAKQIESKVRKEFEEKEKDKALQDRLTKIEDENKVLKEDSEKKMEEQEERFKNQEKVFKDKLEEAMAVKRGVTKNDSPFDNKDAENDNIRMVDGTAVDISKLDYDEIEKLSAEEFRKRFNLPHFYFEGTK